MSETSPSGSATSAAAAHERRVAVHGDQERLVRHLAEVTRRHLAGEDADGSRIVGRQPQEIVVLGVLPPRPPQDDPPPAPPVGDLPEEPGVPIDLLPPSEMGLSSLVDPHAASLRVTGEARFSLYLRHFPTFDEQANFSQAEARIGADGQRDGVQDTPESDSGGAPGRGSGRRPARRRAPSDELRAVYVRYDVTAPIDITIELPSVDRTAPRSETQRLTNAVTTAVFGNVREPATAEPGGRFQLLTGRGQRVPRQVIAAGPDEYARYLHEHASPDWVIPAADVVFTVTVQRSLEGPVRADLSLINVSVRGERENGFVPELSLYNAGFDARIEGGELVNMGYSVIEHDYRVDPVVYAHGRFCCADDRADATRGELATTTWPLYRQTVYESRREAQPSYRDLAAEPVEPLRRIHGGMRDFERLWRAYLDAADCQLTGEARRHCEQDLVGFVDEAARFERGVDLIEADVRGLGRAFRMMNEAFVPFRAGGPLDAASATTPDAESEASWRLFQIVFIVSNLAAIAAREADETSDLRDELSWADVLWFPTGGGKSDAIYGLAATTMFFDRLRGKHSGVSALVRFPLRMLSVQQLDRTLRLIAACETVRQRHHLDGDEFWLGYFVGRNNTPNRLTDPTDQRWRDITAMQSRDDEWRAEHVVITVCPYCLSSEIALEPDAADVRLWHRCRACDRRLPVVISDDEVYRYLPAIVIATVDKLASVAFNPHFSHLTHGPRYRCPDHGFVTFATGPDQRCLARAACTHPRTDWQQVEARDPAPALLVQDELHLLSEELGTFAAHYETLFQLLCTKGSGYPPKILAATATISDYENQVRQLYALRPRRFPSEGFRDGETFYAQRHDDLARRIFVGALPSQVDTTTLAERTGLTIRAELERLRAVNPSVAIAELGLAATSPAEVAELLFAYELQLAYANKKTDADRYFDRMSRAAAEGQPASYESVRLNGQTPLAEISRAIRRVERETLAIPGADRLAVIAGTSLVSHGVDLERLNVEFILGLPPTIAFYVQTTSRAGRSSVGLVLCALGRNFARDRSVYHFFDPTHRYIDSLVEPVALNRFSVHGPKKTAPGLLAGLLLCDWDRNLTRLAPTFATETSFVFADQLRNWLSHAPISVDADLRADLRAAFGLHAPVLDAVVADRFGSEIDRLFEFMLTSIRGSNERMLSRAMRPVPARSFRDIDESVTFGVVGAYSREKFRLLSRYDDVRALADDEIDIAEERDAT